MIEKREFLERLDQINEIRTLPAVLEKINQVLSGQGTSLLELGGMIERDPAITVRLLRLVNSSFFGFRGKINNIPHALVILGLTSVRNVVISISVIHSLRFPNDESPWSSKDFWRHSVAVGVSSKFLAEKMGLAAIEESFAAGLLHDMGKIILAQHFPELFHRVWQSMSEEGVPFAEAEKDHVPLSHAQIGSYLAGRWRFPSALVEAIEYHHESEKRPEGEILPLVVRMGNEIAHLPIGCEKPERSLVKEPEGTPEALSAKLDEIREWLPDLSAEVESACRFLLDEEDL